MDGIYNSRKIQKVVQEMKHNCDTLFGLSVNITSQGQ